MEEENKSFEEEAPYTPRPKGQLWLARIALVIFILFVAFYIFNMATGGKYAYPWN